MTEKTKKKLKLTLLRGTGIALSVGLPLWAILEKFPVWKEENGTGRTVGVGAVMALVVALITFRKTVWSFLREKTGMKSAPPLLLWCVLLTVCLGIQAMQGFLADMVTVCIAGITGCGLGTASTVIGNLLERSEEEEDGDDGNA